MYRGAIKIFILIGMSTFQFLIYSKVEMSPIGLRGYILVLDYIYFYSVWCRIR